MFIRLMLLVAFSLPPSSWWQGNVRRACLRDVSNMMKRLQWIEWVYQNTNVKIRRVSLLCFLALATRALQYPIDIAHST